MVSMQIAALVVAIAGANDTVLLDFHASWCAPCRSMEGTVAELERAGYPVRKVDTDRERALADRFRVQTIPCFVLLVNGREAGRVTGAVRRGELLELFSRAGVKPHDPQRSIARGQSPDGGAAPGPLRAVQAPAPSDARLADVASAGADASSISPQRLIQSSVRLKINDPTGASYGSGTIIDARQGEALVLTCGHIFRDSNGKGEILVDLLGPGAPEHLPGRLVSYDLKQDVALVSIRPGVAVDVAPVAPKGQRIARGDRVITVGCNNGGPATAIYSQINSLDKFLGPPNVQVAGAPVEGRSGGGLFTSEGLVIGVCNAADPADNEGLYAALASIHQQLDQAGLSAVYAARPAPSEPAATDRMVVPAMAESMPDAGADLAAQARQLAANGAASGAASGAMSSFERATLSELRTRTDGAEVICIIRSLNDAHAPSEVIRLDHASPEFLNQLSADRRAQDARHLTSLEVPAQRAAAPPRRASGTGQGVRWSTVSRITAARAVR